MSKNSTQNSRIIILDTYIIIVLDNCSCLVCLVLFCHVLALLVFSCLPCLKSPPPLNPYSIQCSTRSQHGRHQRGQRSLKKACFCFVLPCLVLPCFVLPRLGLACLLCLVSSPPSPPLTASAAANAAPEVSSIGTRGQGSLKKVCFCLVLSCLPCFVLFWL